MIKWLIKMLQRNQAGGKERKRICPCRPCVRNWQNRWQRRSYWVDLATEREGHFSHLTRSKNNLTKCIPRDGIFLVSAMDLIPFSQIRTVSWAVPSLNRRNILRTRSSKYIRASFSYFYLPCRIYLLAVAREIDCYIIRNCRFVT